MLPRVAAALQLEQPESVLCASVWSRDAIDLKAIGNDHTFYGNSLLAVNLIVRHSECLSVCERSSERCEANWTEKR